MNRDKDKGVERSISPTLQSAVQRDYEHFAEQGLPPSLEGYLLDEYGLDVSAEYAGFPLKNPWGKASGQLSMTARQVDEDVAAGLSFVVLKTVIAQDQSGEQSMAAWAIPETRMVAEQIVGRSGERGWTITWKGRGWWQSFEAYLQLIRDARRLAAGTPTLIVPSCKYHLPSPTEPDWRVNEYDYTTRKILDAWSAITKSQGSANEAGEAFSDPSPQPSPRRGEGASAGEGARQALGEGPTQELGAGPGPMVMPLEKDFSPTLAGSDRAAAQSKIIEWLRVVPRLVRDSAEASGLGEVRIGLKMFNALFDDDFQLEMLAAIHETGADRPDFFVYANRLFDPQREFDGHCGVAFGGPDLSDRNLRVLDRFFTARKRGEVAGRPISWSATGNITTGRLAVDYALRGATSFQLHTFFQLPSDQYSMKTGNRTQRALHELYFHPQTGFIVCLFDVANRLGLSTKPLRFLDFPRHWSAVA